MTDTEAWLKTEMRKLQERRKLLIAELKEKARK